MRQQSTGLPTVAFAMGDPAGISSELAARLLADPEMPGPAAKLCALIAAGGATIEGPFEGEEGITLMVDLDAGATGTMISAMIPELITPIMALHKGVTAGRGAGCLRACAACNQF